LAAKQPSPWKGVWRNRGAVEVIREALIVHSILIHRKRSPFSTGEGRKTALSLERVGAAGVR